jgi:hypothetical protein
MRLFIDLYLDEDVSVLLSELLKSRGFGSTTTRDAAMLGRSDNEQLENAATRESTLFTHNRVHFEELHAEYLQMGKEHYGIIIARRDDEHSVLQRLLRILNHVSADEMKN